MTRLIWVALLVAGLVVAGDATRRAAEAEARLAAAGERLVTRGPDAALDEYDAVAASLGYVTRVPVAGPALRDDIAAQRNLAAYWSGNYGALPGLDDESGPAADAGTALLSANAALRRAREAAGSRQEQVRALEEAVTRYATLVERHPESLDAAFNYEFAVRRRNQLSAARGGQAAAEVAEPSDLQGEEGSPPEGAPSTEFNVIVPLRPEERGEIEAGSGGARRGKG